MNPEDFSFIDQVGKVMLFYSPACGSTQDLVHRCADAAGGRLPVAVVTFDQRSGRGQEKRKWISQPGMNLALSVVWPVGAFQAADLTLLNKAITLACLAVIRQSGAIDAMIKWPNDLRADGAKLCGLLMESAGNGNDRILCAGCGLNVNQTDFQDLGQPVTSLKLHTGMDYNLMDLARNMLSRMEAYVRLAGEKPADILHEYELALEGRGQSWLCALNASGEVPATLMGTDVYGRAILLFEDGRQEHFHYGEARLLKKI